MLVDDVVVLEEEGAVEVEEDLVLADVRVDELDDGATELLELVVELTVPVEPVDEVEVVVPPDDGAKAR